MIASDCQISGKNGFRLDRVLF